MSADNSPGPWRAAGDCSDSRHAGAALYDAQGRKIASFWRSPAYGKGCDAALVASQSDARTRADATLAAAAPALRDALRALLDFAEHGDISGRGRTIAEVKRDARAVLEGLPT